MSQNKILFIITKGDNIGGAQIYVLELAKRFKQDGFDVSVIAGTKGYLTNKLIEEQIEVVHIDSLKMQINLWFDIISIFKIYKYLKKNKPNIVSLNSSKVGIVGRIACFFNKTPCVFTVHGWSFTDGVSPKKQFFFRNIEKLLKPFCTAWITVSQYDFDLGIKSKVVVPNKTTLIHNGVIIKNQLATKTEILEETQKVKIVFTARHDFQKDHLTLFKAIQNIDNIIVYLLGDGPLMEQNKQKAKELDILNKVEFVGFTTNVENYLADSDIFVLITNWEGFPISILEAMNNKLPIIATDVCGNSEAMINGETGFLVAPKNAKMLKEKISALAANSTLRKKMGEAGYEYLKHNFSFDFVYQKTKKVFTSYI